MLSRSFILENQKVYFDNLLVVNNYETFDPKPILCEYLPVYENKGVNSHLENTGYDNSDAILNMGTIFLTLVAIPFLTLTFLLLTRLCYCKTGRNFFKRQLSQTVFNRIIAFIESSVLNIATSCWINIYQVDRRGVIEKSLSYYVSIALLIFLAVYMIVLFIYLLCSFKHL